MKDIYYIVSEEVMEILQVLLSLFSNGQNMQVIKDIFLLLKQNDFDIRKTILNLDSKTIEPIIEQFVKNINNRPTETVGRYQGLTPISNIADKDIVYCLNKYLGQNTTC